MPTDPYLSIDDFEVNGNPENSLNNRLDDAIGKMVGYLAIATGDADVSLVTTLDADGDAVGLRYNTFEFTGTLTFNRRVTLPGVAGIYYVWNNTTGSPSFDLIFEAAGAASPTVSVSVPQGSRDILIVADTTFDVISWLT